MRTGVTLAILSWLWPLGAAAGQPEKPPRWLLATIAPEGSPSVVALRSVTQLLTKSSGGQLGVSMRLGGILGDEIDTLADCRTGAIQLCAVSIGALALQVPELQFFEQPYLFRDLEAWTRTLVGYHYGTDPRLQSVVARHDLVLLGLTFIGWRNISSARRPIRSPGDLTGLRVRAQGSPLNLELWRAWGAIPKATALTELNSALEISLVEAFDVPSTFIFASSLDARIKYYTVTRHVLQIGLLVANRKAWEALPTQWKKHFFEGLPPLLAAGDREHTRFDQELVDLLPRRGVQIIRPDPDQLAAFERAAAAAGESYLRRTATPATLQLFDQLRKAVSRSSGARRQP